ncbi:MAG: site-2 protease family protein [Thaumarchaeota archaeon]|nr:site-2 protease family protein [Nitrososphaerota archaeon]
MKCDYCGADEDLPFTCNYCGGTFCGEHRLPEAHRCTGDLSRKFASSPLTTRSWDASSYSGTSSGRSPSPYLFSQKEVRDIIIAWAALALAFTIARNGGVSAALQGGIVTLFFISFVAVGSGFVLHELMHKFTAERYGYWAEFRMWITGIILALVTSTLGFIFAAPGATYISGNNVSERENGIISVAGPLTNIAIAILFLLVGSVGTGIFLVNQIASIGFPVNLFLALFNMLPIMPLDGAKVFRWNKLYWTAIFGPLLLVFLFLFFGL